MQLFQLYIPHLGSYPPFIVSSRLFGFFFRLGLDISAFIPFVPFVYFRAFLFTSSGFGYVPLRFVHLWISHSHPPSRPLLLSFLYILTIFPPSFPSFFGPSFLLSLIRLFCRPLVPPTPMQPRLIPLAAFCTRGGVCDLYRCPSLWPPSLFIVCTNVCALGEGEGVEDDAEERERRVGEVHVRE